MTVHPKRTGIVNEDGIDACPIRGFRHQTNAGAAHDQRLITAALLVEAIEEFTSRILFHGADFGMRVAESMGTTGVECHSQETLPESLVFEQHLARYAAGDATREHDQELVTHERTHKMQVLLDE
jgi:hypothetical protein